MAMFQQIIDPLERALDQDNGSCADCARPVVEVEWLTVVGTFHSHQLPGKSTRGTPSLSEWPSSAIRALKLDDVCDDRFKNLVSSHHKLADALNDLRNKAGPASHGKDPYLARLAEHHRRSAVLAADAIVAFLYQAYLDTHLDPISSREPWERFARGNALIDAHVGLVVDAEDGDSPTLRFLLPGGEEIPIRIEASRLLYQLDWDAYVEALNAARGAMVPIVTSIEG